MNRTIQIAQLIFTFNHQHGIKEILKMENKYMMQGLICFSVQAIVYVMYVGISR